MTEAICEAIPNQSKYHAGDETAPIPCLALSSRRRQRLHFTLSLQLCEVRRFGESDCAVDYEHEEAYEAQSIEECFPLPDLVIVIQLDRCIQRFVEEINAACNNALGEVCPGVSNRRVENSTDGIFPIYCLVLIGVAITLIKPRRILAEV